MWIKKLPGIVANAAVLIAAQHVPALFHVIVRDSDDCSAVSPPANGGRACERDDYAFFHDIGGVLFRGRGIQPEERPGAYVCGERTV